ncbi:MAG: phage portal protein [Gammaproteobacteria bacterium]|uniref:Putative portal protein n=2 Tax=viral metagenome TaxID=1070528 RepID=A0A6M3XGZ9_9ZZZZ|nr:phage portal protein [Gammaproteobacteria bacterium]MBU2067484.1 phage portal protein [Gammaproteobacteria bacterium]MBU2139494.1 phage portal protein [Gammaproteobacteria bacterium]MBU2255921.1 phage portal protein [Gammaproteobacteria bacterium]MBU2295566.1 phage portal protein [Gammaproteobacteria bacterium]
MSRSLKSVLSTALIRSAQPGLIKSALSGFAGQTLKLTDGNFWQAFYGTDSASGKTVSQQTALQVSTVWACVRLIAETIATLPLALYERGANSSVIATSHALHDVISRQPNADQTPVEFWECVVASLLLHGNAFLYPTFSAGRVIALEFLLPQCVSVRRLTDGSIEYTFTDLAGNRQVMQEGELIHIRGFGTDPLQGLSPLSMGRQVFGAAMAADESASKMFANGMKLGGVLSTDTILKPDQRKELRASMADQFTGAVNTGKTMVLEAGMKYQQVSMTPEDAQMLQTRGFNVEEICRWFRTPPWMVGHSAQGATKWGSGMEQEMIAFLSFTLLPWMKRIEHSIDRWLLQPDERRRYFAKFNPEGLLRADSAARASFYSSMVQNGIYTRDDCREKENLPKRGGNADELTVQSNLLPIDKLGGESQGQQARNALLDWLNQENPERPNES